MVTKKELLRHPRADNIAASDAPHSSYYSSGIPILSSTVVGNVVQKSVTRTTTHCPDCDVPARSFGGEPICPECGLVCQGKDSKSQELVIDSKAAGRVETNNNGGKSHP